MLKGVDRKLDNVAVAILLLFCVCSANAEMYKWVDENGKVVYGDRPASIDADKIKKQSHTSDPLVEKRLEKQQKLLNVYEDEHAEKDVLKKSKKEKEDKQREICEQKKERYQIYKDSRYLYKKTDDPANPKVYADEERKAEELKYKNYIEKNC